MKLKVQYKKFQGEEVKVAASQALKNKLFVPGWELSGELKSIKNGNSPYDIVCLAYIEEKPVSIVIADENTWQTPMAFTSKMYRRKGIAKNLISKTGVKIKFGGDGIEGSEVFWQKLHNK